MPANRKEAMSIIGVWDVRMKTPIGTVDAVFTFTEIGGALQGEAVSANDRAVMHDIATDQDSGAYTVSWSQSVTKPMRMNLRFEIEVHGDTFTGFSRAGRLPKSTVSGVRAAPSSPPETS
jgi:hypothetical protein